MKRTNDIISINGGKTAQNYDIIGINVNNIPVIIEKLEDYRKQLNTCLISFETINNQKLVAAIAGENAQSSAKKYVSSVKKQCMQTLTQLDEFKTALEEKLKTSYEKNDQSTVIQHTPTETNK